MTPDWAERDPGTPPGEVWELRFASEALGREVPVSLYIPARFNEVPPLPLIVVHDGGDYLERASMSTVLDNLMHRRLLADSVVALVHPDPATQLNEYGGNPDHSRFLNHELVPDLEARLPLLGQPAGRVLVGASFGGVATLAAAAKAPGFYGGLLLESASLRHTGSGDLPDANPVRLQALRFVDSLRSQPRRITQRIFQSYGAAESLAPANRAMIGVLRQLAPEVKVVEFSGGHDWTAWRDGLLDGLGWLLPGYALRGPALG